MFPNTEQLKGFIRGSKHRETNENTRPLRPSAFIVSRSKNSLLLSVKLDQVARSTKISGRWKFFFFWQRTRTLKFSPDLEVRSVFKDYDFHLVCSVEDNLEDMDALSFNYWLAKFIQEVANKKGSRYSPRMLYGIVCGLKRHLEEVKGASAFNILDYKEKR